MDSSSLPDPLMTFDEYLVSVDWDPTLAKLWLEHKPGDVWVMGMKMLEKHRDDWEAYRKNSLALGE